MTPFPRLYLCAGARLAAGATADLMPELASAGIDIFQLREKQMEALDLLRAGESIRDACAAASIPFIVNDRPDLAVALEADGVHLGQDDLPVEIARRILGSEPIVGRSTHATHEIDAEVADHAALDYLAVGPVRPTPTKPGRAGVGHELLRYAAERVPLPWFVTGGMAPDTLAEAMDAGARRFVVVRAVTEADDPVRVVDRMRSIIDEVPVIV